MPFQRAFSRFWCKKSPKTGPDVHGPIGHLASKGPPRTRSKRMRVASSISYRFRHPCWYLVSWFLTQFSTPVSFISSWPTSKPRNTIRLFLKGAAATLRVYNEFWCRLWHWFFDFFEKLQKHVWSVQLHTFDGFLLILLPFFTVNGDLGAISISRCRKASFEQPLPPKKTPKIVPRTLVSVLEPTLAPPAPNMDQRRSETRCSLIFERAWSDFWIVEPICTHRGHNAKPKPTTHHPPHNKTCKPTNPKPRSSRMRVSDPPPLP